MLEEVVVGCQEVRRVWRMRQNFVVQLVQLLKHWLCDMRLMLPWRRIGPILLVNASCRCCSFWCMSLISWAHFSDVMFYWGSESCRGSDQQQTTRQWPWPFLGASLALGSALELLLGPTTELVITGCHIKPTFCHTSEFNQEMAHCCCVEWEDDTSKIWFFLIYGQLMRHPRIELFCLSNLLQMPNDCRMVDVEFFSNFLCGSKRISFSDCSQFVVVSFWWLEE